MVGNVELLYEPLPKQLLFHQSEKKYRLMDGGFGNGKTTCGAAEAIQLSIEYPNNQGLVGRSTYPELRDSTRKEILDFPVKVNGVESKFLDSPLVSNFNRSENTLTLINGSQILFRALDDAFGKIKSMNLGWAWVDQLEEIPKEMWLGLLGRLRRQNVRHTAFGTCNPEGHDWIWQDWLMQPSEDHFYISAATTENTYLPDGYVDSLIKQYPEEWVKRYVFGSRDTFEGLVYKDYTDRFPYVIEKYVPTDDDIHFVSLDHGYRNPTAVLWGAVDVRGRVTIRDEFYAAGKLVSEIAEIIKAKTQGFKIQRWLIDPSCGNKSGVTGRSVINEFEDNGIFFEPANNDVRAGINRVQEYFKLDDKGNPKIRIVKDCVHLRGELQTYRWKDLKPGATQNTPEKPLKKGDHQVDSLRYLVNYLYSAPKPKVKQTGWRKWLTGDYVPKYNTPSEHWMAE